VVDVSTLGLTGRRRSSRNPPVSRAFGETLDRSTQSTLPIHSSPSMPQNKKYIYPDPEPSPATRNLRKRPSEGSRVSPHDPMDEVMKPLTNEERRAWKGWVELESDPVSFRIHATRFPPSNHL
jgi:hypothetical protein